MKDQIKQLRVEIDGLAQLCEGLKPLKDGAAIHNRLKDLTLFSVHSTESEIAAREARYKKECDKAIRETSKNTDEIKEAIKSLKLSKAWLGKVLESLGSENPYGSGYKTVEDIVPETDKAEIICGSIGIEGETPRLEARSAFTVAGKLVAENYGTHIEKVEWLRTEIKCKIESEYISSMTYQPANRLEAIARTNAYNNLCEARFWLGFELGRVRDESK